MSRSMSEGMSRSMSKVIWQKRTTAHKLTQEFNIERKYVLNSRCSRRARYFLVKM